MYKMRYNDFRNKKAVEPAGSTTSEKAVKEGIKNGSRQENLSETAYAGQRRNDAV